MFAYLGASRKHIVTVTIIAALAGSAWALVTPEEPTPASELAFRHPDLEISKSFRTSSQLPPELGTEAELDLATLGVDADGAYLDWRGGRWETLLPVEPLLPGTGVGNDLSWQALGLTAPADVAALEQIAWDAFVSYLEVFHEALRIELSELPATGRVTVHDGGDLIQIFAPRVVGGVPVRDSFLTAVVNHGNLILLGAHNWADVDVSTQPTLRLEDASAVVQSYLGSINVSGEWGESALMLVPMARGADPVLVAAGAGYTYRLAWVVRPQIEGDMGSWEALIDARDGEILSFEDKNHYAEAKGGVYPKTNDGIDPDGVEQAGWPMPFMFVGSATTDTGGNYDLTGSQTATFNGPFVNMADQCGIDSLTQSGGIDWGTSDGDDCATPGFGGPGNTHSSRSGFYELNRIAEMARSHLPSNGWLQNRLTANMNINLSCNAFWNGSTVNFYRSGGGCSNTGEIAAVFDHEWGHGMDDNDVNGTISGPSGEGIADLYSTLRLYDSCIGRNFRPGVQCSGFGDPCLDCTGVRDIDYLKRASGLPHDYSWSNANCGGQVHCVGSVYAEAVWSLWQRNLQSPPYNLDNNTAAEIVTRLTYLGAGNTSFWFSGGPPNGGCSATSGYMNYLAVDDDNGNLNDGTPHMTALFESFDDQEIACGTPTVQDSGCAGAPTAAPNVTATSGDNSVSLSWGAVAGASSYDVFRTEGIFACDWGKVKVGSTTGTSFTDTGLQNGRDYSYVVIGKGSSAACFGPASSCDTVVPGAIGCSVDGDCDDGLFCNGAEECKAGTCRESISPCSADQICDEIADFCEDPAVSPAIWMSFQTNAVIPGVGIVTDEDVVAYDEGSGTWSLIFDGSDVGLGSLEIDGLARLASGELLLSFTTAATISGIPVDDSDIVLFNPTSLGSNTAGSFSLHFDGSDVALTTNGEDVDAIALAADGSLIVSTTGRFRGTGASGADEDLFLFTGTLGSSTSGSFSVFFDGSDVALNTSSGEDFDAAALTGSGDLLFSTAGSFSVSGLSGDNEDVAQVTGTFGSTTSGTFSMRLDLSALGINPSEDVGGVFIVE